MLTLTPITKQYVAIDVAGALASGAPAVISGVDVALVQPRSAPVATTAWVASTYASGTATVLLAGYDANPTGALVVPAGQGADLWIRVVDNPEVTATRVMRVIVEPGPDAAEAVLAAGTPFVQTIAGLTGIVSGPALMIGLGTALTDAIDAEITAHGASVTDATTTTKGIVRLAGDLAGTAAAPTVPGLAAKANTSSLAPVATSGAYADLTGKPTLGTAAAQPSSAFDAAGAAAGRAPLLVPTATKTATYTAAVGDLAIMNVPAGGTPLNLPTAPADKSQVGYRAIGATTAAPLTINRGGSTDTIGTAGATSASIPMADETVILQYDAPNTRWLAVANVRTQASLDSRYASIGAATASPLRATPITDNCFTSASNTAQTSTGTGRKGYTVAVDATDLRFVFANWFNQGAAGSPVEQDTPNANPITVAASVEVGGVKYRLTVAGQSSWTIAGGAWVQTDPIPVEVTAGQVVYAWCYVQPTVNWYYNGNSQFSTGQGGFSVQRTDAAAAVTSGSNIVTDTAVVAADFGKPVTGTGIPAGTYVGTVTAGTQFLLSSTSGSQTSVNASSAGTGVVIGGDLTAPGIAAATVPEAAAVNMYMPSQILGRPLLTLGGATAATPVVLLTGDSLMAGSNDYSSGYSGRNVLNAQLAGGGYTGRALSGKVPFINAAVSGDRAQFFVTSSYHLYRWTWASAATTMLCNYGINDVNNARTLAQLQADLITIWTLAARRGMRVIEHTITPFTSSTDGWATTVNQTIANAGKEAVRTGVNDWLRDGAPVTSAASLTPVAVGTVGALRAGSSGHPLFTYFEAADIAEGTRNSGRWTTLSGRSVADGSIGNSSVNLSSATAAFTSADLGKLVTIAGAGTAGGTLVTPIISVNSGTAVTIGTSTSAAVSSAALTIGVSTTKDGLHPSGQLATLMAAAIDLTKIV